MKDCKHPTCDGKCRRAKKPKKLYKIPKKSIKRKQDDKIYFELRDSFLKKNPVCQIKSPECTIKSTVIHHTKSRGIYYLAQNTWLASCHRCNTYVESHDAWARENGFKKSKFTPV